MPRDEQRDNLAGKPAARQAGGVEPTVPQESPPAAAGTSQVNRASTVREAARPPAAAAEPGRLLVEAEAVFGLNDVTQTVRQGPAQSHGSQVLSKGVFHVPGYRGLGEIGRGTYGIVHLCAEEKTGIRVAVKFFMHGTGPQWQMLQAEVKQLAMLVEDPGIVQLLDVEPEATPPYYVMKYAEGGSLAARLKADGPLPAGEALRLFRQVARALAYVHVKGVRHCDLKPSNVLLTALGAPLIADFGQAHLSSDIAPALGTFFYMAPEQADLTPQAPDARWDVYGLGAVFYAMLTGRPPRQSPEVEGELANTAELGSRLKLYREAVAKAPRPDGHRRVRGVDRELAEVIDRCLDLDPERRYGSANAVLEALDLRERRRRQRPLLVFGLLAPALLLLLAAGLGLLVEERAVDSAERELLDQLAHSDRLTARMAANVIDEKLKVRKRLIEEDAPKLAEAAAARDRGALEQRLAALFAERDKVSPGSVYRWTVVDERGMFLANHPPLAPPDPDHAYRDWFHGQGRDFLAAGGRPRAAGGAPPVRSAHVSQPYVGNLSRKLSVSVSAPIRDAAGKTVGVLAWSMELEKLHTWLKGVGSGGSCVVLFNQHGHCVMHEHAADTVSDRCRSNPPDDLRAESLRELRAEGVSRRHADPLNGKEYVGGHAAGAGKDTVGWSAVVQHEREQALEPVRELRAEVLRLGLLSLGGVSVALAGVWWWLLRTVREGGKAHA